MAKKYSLYAKALVSVLEKTKEKDQEGVASRFARLLKKQGDLRYLSSILREFTRLWEQRKGQKAILVSNKKLPISLFEEFQKTLLQQGYEASEAQDERVLGGMAVFLNDEYLFDNTVKGRLQRIKERSQK